MFIVLVHSYAGVTLQTIYKWDTVSALLVLLVQTENLAITASTQIANY